MIDELASITEAGHVRAGAAADAVNGVVPEAVAEPGTREEAAALVRAVRDRGGALVARGGGTQLDFGNAPRRLDLLLSTRRLDRVVDYQPDDMTVTVEAGVALAALEELLGTRRQLLPLDPAHPERATAGGVMAAAASGPLRAGYGTPRDWVIGCRVLDSDGELVRGGGQVVKNVAGYDLPKLYTGSFGTLGLIVEVTFKVMPHPGATGYARVDLTSPAKAEALVAQIMNSDLQPAALELMHSDDRRGEGTNWSLLVQFLHVAEAVEWQLRQLETTTQEHGGAFSRLAEAAALPLFRVLRNLPATAPFVARLSGTSSHVAALAAEAARISRQHHQSPCIRAHAATGQVFLYADEDASAELATALRDAAGAAGVACFFPRLPAALNGRVDPWPAAGPELRLMRGIKDALDPRGVFSPGRFVGGI